MLNNREIKILDNLDNLNAIKHKYLLMCAKVF